MGFTAICPNKIQLSCGKNRSFWWGLVVRSAGTTERVFSTSSARVVQTQWGWLVVGCYLIIPPLHPIAVSYHILYIYHDLQLSLWFIVPINIPIISPWLFLFCLSWGTTKSMSIWSKSWLLKRANWVQMSHGSAINCLHWFDDWVDWVTKSSKFFPAELVQGTKFTWTPLCLLD